VVWSADRYAYSAQIYPDKYVWKVKGRDRKYKGSGLYYNQNMVWSDEIVEEWQDKIIPYEIALNGELSEGVVWKYREELMDSQLFEVRYQGPRSDREKVEVFRNGFWNLLENSRTKHLSVRVLEFLSSNGMLSSLNGGNCYGFYNGSKYSFSNSHFTFSEIGLKELLRNQYSWVPCFMQTKNNPFYNSDFSNAIYMIRPSFWSNSLKDILLANYDILCQATLKSFQKSQLNVLKKGSIIVNLLHSNLVSGRMFPKFFILEEECYWYYKVRAIKIDYNSVNVSDNFCKIDKSTNQTIKVSDITTNCGKKYYLLYGSDYVQDKNFNLNMRLRAYFEDNITVYDFVNEITE
jgi:hypothetical protein